MDDPEYNPYLWMIMVVEKDQPQRVWSLFHHGKNSEDECKRLNEDYTPRLTFHVCGMMAGDKP